ncbi:MAG: serine dehydratase subunit alpha family protein [Clostridia bacterium]|nr:serine dehydratase subunit alpha family protein [Clostridia bacterium]
MLNEKIIKTYEDILIEELQIAMGCTEPIAIAYGGAILGDALGEKPTEIAVGLSGNIIKNVKSVIVPSTGGMHGIESAVSAGIVAGHPEKKLEVLSSLKEDAKEKISAFLNSCKITINELISPCTFDLYLEGRVDGKFASVRISERHTNVISVIVNGENVTKKYMQSGVIFSNESSADKTLLSVEKIVEFAENVDLERVKPYVKRQIDMNMTIAEEGLKRRYGASIGQLLYKDGKADLSGKAKAYAASGSDARMSGCELPVCIISGSGNQGITASVPVCVYAKELGCSEEETLRAVILSDLITVHLKTGIGCLSAYCGAISAGCGAGAGICFLKGGRFYEIAHTIVNSVAILSGTICDGAKPSCAAKIAMAVEAGIMGYEMAVTKRQFVSGDGIVVKGVENTIKNVGILAREGMKETDKKIIDIMIGKQ